MQITKRNVELRVDDGLMRVYVAAPKPAGRYPGILFYSDIYQLGGAMTRLVDRLAGYGFVVAAPEIFHRLEPIGTVIEPDDLGRMRGNDAARRTAIAEYDADAPAVIAWLKQDGTVSAEQIGTMGFCIGGHLAFRAAFQPDIKAAVCCYPTGIHNGKLGKGVADTLQRMSEIEGDLLMVFGTLDPHVPDEGRQAIVQALTAAGTTHKILLYEADHTFMRDDGYRYDSAAADAAWAEITAFLKQVLD
ncbi:dienelactone hydrolase family protein [Stenomitos frigidus]|uniref:Dienelactone hydrolase family protein n=1 Tax=Stenomitos frigidus ULC18 TaxID=2107698 RepID=A0A2T1DXP6_9CYAN|nr:dienelactone hydrolase family protein [Stenomitos frigidus]PSB25260.1 dienelactone hydrolase family protein [Stenomitos frigidus ULC18]